jgi:hypothetical protein
VAVANDPSPEALQASCDSGQWKACTELGNRSRRGDGVPLDECRAATLFGKACSGVDGEGCIGLALMYEDGLCVEQDGSRAAALYEKACAAGAGMGCKNLGDLYLAGQGVARNQDRALTYLRKACTLSVASACESADRLVPFQVQLGVRGEADLLIIAASAALAVELSRGALSGVAVAFLKLPPAIRLEARVYPVQWGVARPYLALGSTLQFPAAFAVGASGRAAGGMDFQFGHVHLYADVAYEYFFRNPAPQYSSSYLLLGLGGGWSF